MADATAQPDIPLMTPKDLAAYLGGDIAEGTLAAWRSRGTGPAWLKVGHGVRYRREAVDAWLAGREHAGREAS